MTTTAPTTTIAQFSARLAANIPHGWAGQDALSGGVASAVLSAVSAKLETVLAELQYALAAQRLQTETAPELDNASVDYLGATFPRSPGQSDASFAAAIITQLFQPAVTRAALSNAVQSLTGVQPRMIEPWNPGDTGATDAVSFLDVDTRANPMLVSGEERYTGFIVTVAPVGTHPFGVNAVPTLDDGLWVDVAGSYVGNITLSATSNLYTLVNKLRAYGVTVGIKIVSSVS